MQGATARLEAVKQIVSHNPTRGTFAEALLRELVAEFLPQRYAAATGFVMHTQGRSSQVDVLIYDQLTDAPVFRDGGFVVLTPGTAKVAIEVKSDLKGATEKSNNDIYKSLQNIRSIKSVDPDVKGFIFGFAGNEAEVFARHFDAWRAAAAAADNAPPREQWPDGAYNLGRKFTLAREPTFDEKGRLLPEGALVLQRDDDVIRSFLTATLQALALSDLRIFFKQHTLGAEVARF